MVGLAHLRGYINRQDRQYTKRQRASIKVMALRRQADQTLLEPLPAFECDEGGWDSFFERHVTARDEIHQRLLDWHLNRLEACTDLPVLFSKMSALFSTLLLKGYSTDRLFRAVCKGVLDPQNLRGRSPADNFCEWLQSLAHPTPTEFLAYTRLIPLGSISKTLLGKWSAIRLPTLDTFDSDRTLAVLIGDTEPLPYIVTRRTVTQEI